MNYTEFQIQHKVWVDSQFPHQTPDIPAAGMVEEAGELMHALLKMEQASRWGKDPRYTKLYADLKDAIGDCAIYACSWCNATGNKFAECIEYLIFSTPDSFSPMEAAANLMSAAVNAVRRPTSLISVVTYVRQLRHVAHLCSLDFEECVRSTWDLVRTRDRSKPAPTVVCLCGSTRFKQAFIDANFRETRAGRIVLTVGWFSHADGDVYTPTVEEKEAIDELHKRKIDRASEILVLDVAVVVCNECDRPCGIQPCFDSCGESVCCLSQTSTRPYIGDSTRSEIAYAIAHGKRVRYLSKES